MNELQTIEDLGRTIKVRVEKGDKSLNDSDGHYLAAGLGLNTARPLVARRKDMTWRRFLAENCTLKKSRANEFMRAANNTTTMTKIRADTAARVKNHADKKKQVGGPLANGQSPGKPKWDQDPGENAILLADIAASIKHLGTAELQRVRKFISNLQKAGV